MVTVIGKAGPERAGAAAGCTAAPEYRGRRRRRRQHTTGGVRGVVFSSASVCSLMWADGLTLHCQGTKGRPPKGPTTTTSAPSDESRTMLIRGLLTAVAAAAWWASASTATAAPGGLPVRSSTQPRMLAAGVPMSPCPGVFRYERHNVPGGWAGVVTVPAPPTNMPLVLRVDLAIAAALTTKYAGTLQLQEGRRALLVRLAAGDRRPVRYTLRFPVGMPLPAVTRVHAMGKDLCRGWGAGAAGGGGGGGVGGQGVTTTISLEHSVRPERVPQDDAPLPQVHAAPTTAKPPGTVQLFLQNDGDASSAATSSTASTASAAADGAAVAAEVVDEDDQVCGRPVHHRLLVAGGGVSDPGDWPWLAAVFASTTLGLEYHCAGTLVSAGHVLTAAHCVTRLSPESLLVYVGRHNVRKWTEPQAQAREVAAVHVHPDHQAVNYTADVAVLQLSERVAFDWFVRPICIDWTGPEALAEVVGRVGTVVGWGRDEHGHVLSAEPRAARLPIVSQEACLRSRSEFLHVTSERTFCAGFRNGSGPCNGDSGSGLMLPQLASPSASTAEGVAGHNNHRPGLKDAAPSPSSSPSPSAFGPWFLRGVVSLSLMDGERRTCDLRHFVVFTDVAKFRPWLGALIRPRPARGSGRPSAPASKQVETVETQTDLDDQPIWDSDPLPNRRR